MRGVRYFDIEKEGFVVHGNEVVFQETKVDLSDIKLWKRLLGSDLIPLMNKKDGIQIVVPYHNSSQIGNTLDSLVRQKIPKRVSVFVTVVASFCKKKYLLELRKKVASMHWENYTFRIIEQSKPGKPLALNTGMQKIDSDIIIQVVDDVVLDDNVISLLYLGLKLSPDYGASVSVGIPTLESCKSNLLREVQQIHIDKFYTNDQYALIGRAFAFRKSIIPSGFPEKTMSEDFWLELMVREKSRGFLVVNHCKFYFERPGTWGDYLRQIDRYDIAFRQLKKQYGDLFHKHFGKIKNDGYSMFGVNNLFQFLRFMVEKTKYSYLSKIVYVFVVFYQLHYLKIKNSLIETKGSYFKREKSTC